MKNLEEMTDHELLLELVKSQQKNTFNGRISAIAGTALLVLILIVSLIMVPRTFITLDNIDKAVAEAEVSLEGIDAMVEDVSKCVDDNTEDLNKTLKNISEIDIDKLNDSIRNLETVTDALSRTITFFRGN